MIFVSAGHYPASPGAKHQRFIEHDEAVLWANGIAESLGKNAFKVPSGILRTKIEYINARIWKNDIAIEIHFNSCRDLKGEGSETLYLPGHRPGKRLACDIQDSLVGVFAPDRGANEGWYRDDESRGPDFFLAKTKCTSIIVMPEFVHNDEKIIGNREKGIQAIAEALSGY